MPGYNVTELYAAADPQHMPAAKTALDELLHAICVSVPVSEVGPKPL